MLLKERDLKFRSFFFILLDFLNPIICNFAVMIAKRPLIICAVRILPVLAFPQRKAVAQFRTRNILKIQMKAEPDTVRPRECLDPDVFLLGNPR